MEGGEPQPMAPEAARRLLGAEGEDGPIYLEETDWHDTSEEAEASVDALRPKFSAYRATLEGVYGRPTIDKGELDEWVPWLWEAILLVAWRVEGRTLSIALVQQHVNTPVTIEVNVYTDDEIADLSAAS